MTLTKLKGNGTLSDASLLDKGQHRDGSPRVSHTPVLLDEILELMKPAPGKTYIDATGGPGSTSQALLEASPPDGRVLTIDCDPRAQKEQEKLLGKYGDRSVRVLANFERILDVAKKYGFVPCDGIVYDLGVSSAMLDRPEYGMSFRHNSRLDMRFDPSGSVTAYDLVNSLSEQELADLLKGMDERRFARKIAGAIVREREKHSIETTVQLADIVAQAIPRKFHPRDIHVATKTFLALRVATNREKETLERSLRDCREILRDGGILAVVCWSSFEDRIVKSVVRDDRARWKKLTRKPVTPGIEEIERNPRSRSARLRAFRAVA